MKELVNEKAKHLLIIVGPTAVGKTAIGILLAKYFNTEIISADSRQIYKEMEIGTAKPSHEDLLQVRHHLINSHSIYDEFNAGMFEQTALEIIDALFKKHSIAIAVGGSGLYVDALCNGMDEMPKIDPEVRVKLNKVFETKGIHELQSMLQESDPKYYEQVDKQNPQRLIRAIEICLTTGLPYSLFRKKTNAERPFKIIKIGLELDREILYQRIELRMDKMIEDGLFEEASRLFDMRHLNALQTVGYSEIFDFLENKYNRDESIRLLKRNSRRYAKRQFTWFKKDQEIKWFHPDSVEAIVKYALDEIKKPIV